MSFRAVAAASDYRVVLGGRIRAERRRAGLTQEVLAERADLHPNYFGRVERGEEDVSLRALRQIAKALNMRVRDLVVDI
ncbi:MAG TPA: helix-turn-helix transcriptional regulator [Candidatus Binatia bacterium]|nr:helix-turn-helix transcriptional regulator [Candidatus Binatia bacterium]